MTRGIVTLGALVLALATATSARAEDRTFGVADFDAAVRRVGDVAASGVDPCACVRPTAPGRRDWRRRHRVHQRVSKHGRTTARS